MPSWASNAILSLAEGRTIQIRPRGHSMSGRVNDGDLVTIAPPQDQEISVGDIVLVKVSGKDYLHLVKAIDGKRYLIGNNRGGTNGWVSLQNIYGKAIKVEK